jgi:hypothetical protein
LRTNTKYNPFDSYAALFTELISSQDESICDLISWAVEIFFTKERERKDRSTAPEPQAKKETGLEKVGSDTIMLTGPFDALQEFSVMLANHFRAAPALIRYGAALALLSIIKIAPSFPVKNGSIWYFIVSGVVDSDHLTAAVYLQIVDLVQFSDKESAKTLISNIRRLDSLNDSYDQLYNPVKVEEKQGVDRTGLLDILAKNSPAVAPVLLHKMANSLDYIPSKLKLKQLKLIRIWGRKSTKLDTYLMKMLVPFCSSLDENVQLEAIKVVENILPGFSSATTQDVVFLWNYISALLLPTLETVVDYLIISK